MSDGQPQYRVLARTYRPSSFAELIGQDALVQTLSNAIRSGRLAHAYVLTGVRGVGKTSTARIIAKALNYVGPDGQGGPSLGPFDDCPVCQAIAEDRHPDVLEMDAASHTGVDDVREIIESVRYGPVSARYKVYIIDEVHMLSRSAFNALLKTLEEPPPHTKFIFATTEIRKVPVTVLSRCQRFDLRRVDQATLVAHYRRIAEKEQVAIDAEALALIARAADGSVRDGLSLLDQAIALGAGDGGATEVDGGLVRRMLGLSDRSVVFDLLEAALKGDAAAALGLLDGLYAAGTDALVITQDLLDQVHFITRLRLAPDLARSEDAPESERVRGAALAETYSVPVLTRAWQALLKGLAEVQAAPTPHKALEMVVIRLIHAAGLPTPDEAVRALGPAPASDTSGPPRPAGGGDPGRGSERPRALASVPTAAVAQPVPRPEQMPRPETAPPRAAPAEATAGAADLPADFPALVALLDADDPELSARLQTDIRLVRFAARRIEFNPLPHAPRDLASRLMAALGARTGERWAVLVSGEPGEPTLAEQQKAADAEALVAAAEHPLVRATLDTFPGARLNKIVQVFDVDAEAAASGDPAGDPDDDTAAADDPPSDPDPQETREHEEPW
ncbi:MAG: DNA polymerase III subunit gamma/tau [Rhodospirillaceae bacterium]|nr:DNA polymerase III subunit gamma/tau [Rhodospirillaceae bacterium]